MLYNIFSWTIVWFFQGVLAGMVGYQLNILAAAESFSTDFVKVANDINYITIYEILLCVITNLLTMAILHHTTLSILQLPITVYNLYRYYNGFYILEATDVYKPGVLKSWTRASWARLAVYCVLFVSFLIGVMYDIFYGNFLRYQPNFLLKWMGMSDHGLHPFKEFLGRTANMAAGHIEQAHRNIHRHIQPNGHPYRL